MVLLTLALLAAEPVEFSHAACDDPTKRTAILNADMDDLPVIKGLDQDSAATEARMKALTDKLKSRGHMTEEESSKFFFGVLDNAEFKAAMDEGLNAVQSMMAELEKVASSKDPVANCHTLVSMSDKMPSIKANADKQWGVMEKLIRAEAARRSISLDD